uniref:Uncharacterized protein n=1 Tax=Fagus sylvatica TaxID=28930 RepID=A0A2N9G2A7_FAGSY
MEGMELQKIEGRLSGLTTSNEEGGEAPKKSKQGGWITFPFITGTMMGLSLVAGGWASNLIVYLITEYNVKSITATKISNIVLGCYSLFPVVGAIIADSFLGSFPVVAIFSFVSLLGYPRVGLGNPLSNPTESGLKICNPITIWSDRRVKPMLVAVGWTELDVDGGAVEETMEI